MWPAPRAAAGEVRFEALGSLRPLESSGLARCVVRPEVSFLTFTLSITNNYIGKKGKRLNAADTIFAQGRAGWSEERRLSFVGKCRYAKLL